MAEGKSKGKGGASLLIGLGPPPSLGSRDKVPRAMSSESYRGSASPGDPAEEMATAGEDDENMFEDQAEGEPDELLVGAAHDIISALHSRDAEAVAVALKSFIEMSA